MLITCLTNCFCAEMEHQFYHTEVPARRETEDGEEELGTGERLYYSTLCPKKMSVFLSGP